MDSPVTNTNVPAPNEEALRRQKFRHQLTLNVIEAYRLNPGIWYSTNSEVVDCEDGPLMGSNSAAEKTLENDIVKNLNNIFTKYRDTVVAKLTKKANDASRRSGGVFPPIITTPTNIHEYHSALIFVFDEKEAKKEVKKYNNSKRSEEAPMPGSSNENVETPGSENDIFDTLDKKTKSLSVDKIKLLNQVIENFESSPQLNEVSMPSTSTESMERQEERLKELKDSFNKLLDDFQHTSLNDVESPPQKQSKVRRTLDDYMSSEEEETPRLSNQKLTHKETKDEKQSKIRRTFDDFMSSEEEETPRLSNKKSTHKETKDELEEDMLVYLSDSD